MFILLIIFSRYKYITMTDTKKEINELKDKLSDNQEIMKKKQEEYKKKVQEKKEEIIKEEKKEKVISEEEVMNYVTNLKVVGIGDSIMLNTIDTLYEAFPNGYFDALKNRTICDGCATKDGKKRCTKCRGEGTIRQSKTITVKIPSGIDNGDQMRMSGKGNAGANGGANGDIYIEFSVKNHPLFERKESKLPSIKG